MTFRMTHLSIINLPAMAIKIIFVLLFAVNSSDCSTNSVIHIVDNLITKYKQIYGDITTTNQRWDIVQENVEYPRGDKQKLAQIANVWCAYYECTARMLSKLTDFKRMPSTILAVYEGAMARLTCGLCMAPGELAKIVWTYTKLTKNITFKPLVNHDYMVHDDNGDMTIYHAEPTHAGVYRCEMGRSFSGPIILHVVDEEEYVVVKPSTSMGPYPSPPVNIGKDLTVFTRWSSWSECSSCGKVGRRRRYGICYVKIVYDGEVLKQNSLSPVKTASYANLDHDTRKVMKDYPDGVPCRSIHLPRRIRDIAAAKQRRNEIMIAMCKVACANITNAVGEHKISVFLPTRNIQFEVHGEPMKIRCPGSTLRDIPVSWRIGTKVITPRTLDEDSEGRVHLNARDHLIFTEVQYSDANLYSCWQGDRLAGTVKLVVWAGHHTFWNHYTVLFLMVVAASVLLRYLDRILYDKQ